MGTRPSGRLELTWANKDKRLIGNDEGGYTWVPSNDHRVREVRLLREAGSEGSVHESGERARDNLLIRGDALHALTTLCELPEFAEEYLGDVKLVYMDPPFNTGQAFAHYDDGLEHSVWLTMLRDRLVQVRRLLAPDGSVWVHLDDQEMAYARVLLDELFGRENFIATIVWQKTTSPRNDATHFSVSQDYLLVFAKDSDEFTTGRLPRTAAADAAYRNPDNDHRGPWREDNYKGSKSATERPNLYYPITNPVTGVDVLPPKRSVWRFSRDTHEAHVRDGLLWWGKTGGYTYPKLKRFLTDVAAGAVPFTLWTADEVTQNRRAKQELTALFPDSVPFATPKLDSLRVVPTVLVHARGRILWAGSRISAGMRPWVMRPVWARSVL